jgi:hypothetical protein
MTSRSPKSEAVAYRIWCFAEPRGWDVSVMEIAEALDESPQRVASTCQRRGWIGRMRAPERRCLDVGYGGNRVNATPSRITPDLRRELGV